MVKEITLNQLKIEKANENDWDSILKLLEQTDLTFWFTGSENYNSFYCVKEPTDNEIICCFAIEYEKDIGVLKSFTTIKSLQGKGIGKYIADKTPNICKQLGIKKLYAASIEAPKFWTKTILKEISFNEIKDPYFLKYLNNFCHKVPDYFNKTHYFLAHIS